LHHDRTIFPLLGGGDRRFDDRIISKKIGRGQIQRFTDFFEVSNGGGNSIELNLGKETWRAIRFLSDVSQRHSSKPAIK
jgi:hypothetical protein